MNSNTKPRYHCSMIQRFGFNFYDVFVLLFCVGFSLVCAYPMWYVAVASVTPYSEYIKGGLMLWPKGLDVQYYVGEAVEYLPAYYNLISLPAEAADIRTKMADITNQYLTQMIGGQLDIEEAWPNYVAEYEAAGASELEQMVNDAIAAARNAG